MARTTIAPQAVNQAGITPAFAAVDNTNGMQFYNSGTSILYVKASGALTVTIPTPGVLGALALADLTKVFGGAGDWMVSLAQILAFAQADGYTYLDFSSALGTIGLFQGGVL